jgi:hypothetical protein
MADTKAVDISGIKFTSTVFPTDEDMKLWNSLTREEQIAVVNRELEEGIQSGIAEPTTPQEILARVLAEIEAERQ